MKRHDHAWRDVERTIQMRLHRTGYFEEWMETAQWILQWCEGCGRYKQTKIHGASQSGPAPLRTPVPKAFREE